MIPEMCLLHEKIYTDWMQEEHLPSLKDKVPAITEQAGKKWALGHTVHPASCSLPMQLRSSIHSLFCLGMGKNKKIKK